MSFDSHSLERLRALGRQLPERLPDPEPPRTPKASQVRHKVETEQDPETLFRELMKVSEDGTVPDHLMERLKHLEARRSIDRPIPSPTDPAGLPDAGTTPSAMGRRGKNTRPQPPKVDPGSEEESLYVAFGQLLLEDDEDDA